MNSTRLGLALLACLCAQACAPAGSGNHLLGSSATYGPGLAADDLANTVVGGPYNAVVSYRLLAGHSGSLSSILVYLIPDRTGYSSGTGGQIRVTINTDDGTPAHNPSSTVLAAYVITNAMTLTPSRYFPLLKFDSPATLVAGRIYHVVFTNVDPSPTVNYLSVDGLFQRKPAAATQPTITDEDCAVLLNQAGNPWAERDGFTPTIMMNYSDGWSDGVGYMEAWPTAPQTASGSSAVREVFTVSGDSRTVASVSVRAALVVGNDPLVVHLEDADGTLIEEGFIPAASFPGSGSYAWNSYTFSSPHTLLSGRTYHLDFEASSSSAYQLFPIRKGSAEGFANTTYFPDGHAEFKQEGGGWAGWTMWGVPDRTDGDLQFYFLSAR
jgi:hypothetical protein